MTSASLTSGSKRGESTRFSVGELVVATQEPDAGVWRVVHVFDGDDANRVRAFHYRTGALRVWSTSELRRCPPGVSASGEDTGSVAENDEA